MKRLLILLYALFICHDVAGQDSLRIAFKASYTIEALQSDFVYFRTSLQLAHPSLYRYQTKDSIDRFFNDAYQKINYPMGEIEFWELLQNMVTKIGSGHTNVTPPLASVEKYNYSHHNMLPFYIYTRNSRLYIYNYLGRPDTSFRIGDEILAINNVTAYELLTRARNLVTGDGYSFAYQDHQLEAGGFGRIYNLLHGDEEQFMIGFRSGNTIKTKLIKAVSLQHPKPAPQAGETRKITGGAHYAAVTADEHDEVLHQLSFPDELPFTAMLKINDFTYEDYESFHHKMFKQLRQKETKNLIIDLRNNPGGQDAVCIDLMKYLADSSFHFTLREEGAISLKNFMTEINNAAASNSKAIDFSTLVRRPYQLVAKANQAPQPYSNNFKGRIYVLVNGGTFSAASLLATALKAKINCTIIGQETGGGRAGCDGGTIADVILPNTQFRLRLPLLWVYSASTQPNYGDGLKPDIELLPSALEIYNHIYKGIDPFMLKMKTLIFER